MKQLLTASLMITLLTCQRKHFWHYEIGLRPAAEPDYFRFGTAWHTGMQARWQHKPYEEALADALPAGVQLDEIQAATIAGLLAGYYTHYANDNLVKEVHPEVAFRHAIPGSLSFDAAGKIDGLAVLSDDRLAILEHKTTGDDISSESEYWLRLRFNMQVYQYVVAARALGWNVELALYDVTRKPSIAPKEVSCLDPQGKKIVIGQDGQRVFKSNGEPRESSDKEKGYVLQTRTETPDEFNSRLVLDTQVRPEFYFARREVAILESDLAEFTTQRLLLSRQILACRQTERKTQHRAQAWPRNANSDCHFCPYASFCLQNITPNPAQPPAGFTIGDPHSELTK